MSEAAFPIVGPVLVLLLGLPLSALVAKVLLWALARVSAAPEAFLGLRYSIIAGSSVAPLAWFLSASLHQAETGNTEVVCATAHEPGASCIDGLAFCLTLAVSALVLAYVRGQSWRRRDHDSYSAESAVVGRLAALCHADPHLRPLGGRIWLSKRDVPPIATFGFLRPRIVLRSEFVDALDDDAITAALHHELAHLKAWDPLRYLVLAWSLAMNPLGAWLLRAELRFWKLGREIHCDREAVCAGASAAALAQALVTAARPVAAPVPALGPNEVQTLKLRVSLLLAYDEHCPIPRAGDSGLGLAIAALAIFLALPHGTGTELLNVVHSVSESSVALLVDD